MRTPFRPRPRAGDAPDEPRPARRPRVNFEFFKARYAEQLRRESLVLMPFGKYIGKPVQDLDVSYLCWLLRKGVVFYDERVTAEVRRVHVARCGRQHTPEPR